MNFYTQADLPFYYYLAQNFGISDRHFAGTVGPTFPNRSYLAAATSFGHLTTNDIVPPLGGYQPIGGSIYKLLNNANVYWTDYWQDVPLDAFFDESDVFDLDHTLPLAAFYLQAAGWGDFPSVSFIDPNMGVLGGVFEDDEHPPSDIQKGQHFVSEVVNAVRNGPYWNNTVIFITWDESGGFYDHVAPPAATQAGQRTPDGVFPGQCEDLSNPPSSLQPGGGANCNTNFVSPSGNSVATAENLCPALAADPTGPFPADCAAFDQLGIRVPFLAISPFSKPGYVSHTVEDHTSILAFIEKRFLNSTSMTNRDKFASTMEDMFDFTNSPSLNKSVPAAGSPTVDCTPENAIGAFGAALKFLENDLSF
jgi:phospholipase C